MELPTGFFTQSGPSPHHPESPPHGFSVFSAPNYGLFLWSVAEEVTEFSSVIRVDIHACELFVNGGKPAPADFGARGSGVTVLWFRRQESLKYRDEFVVTAHVGREVAVEVFEEVPFASMKRVASWSPFRKNLLATEQFEPDEPHAVDIGLHRCWYALVQLRRGIVRGADSRRLPLINFLSAPEIDDPNVAQRIDHDIGGLDITVKVARVMEGFETGEDLTHDVDDHPRLDARSSQLEIEEDIVAVVDSVSTGLEKAIEVDAVDFLHLYEANVIHLFEEIPTDEMGGSHRVKPRNLERNAIHVAPVVVGRGIELRSEYLERVLCEAVAAPRAFRMKDDSLSTATDLFGEIVPDSGFDPPTIQNLKEFGQQADQISVHSAGPVGHREVKQVFLRKGWRDRRLVNSLGDRCLQRLTYWRASSRLQDFAIKYLVRLFSQM